jgi:hypothetical protein
MSTSLDMPVIEFSDAVRDLARQLSRSPKSVPAVDAIADSGLYVGNAQDYITLGYAEQKRDRINRSLAREVATQKALADAGIVDDATAIAYLDRVRPIMENWAAQLDALQERHAKEIRDLMNGWGEL